MEGTKRTPKKFKPSSLLLKGLQIYRNNTQINYEFFTDTILYKSGFC